MLPKQKMFSLKLIGQTDGEKRPTNSQNGQMRAGKHSYFSLHLPHLREFFPVLSNSFSNRHEGSLRDYIQTSVMVQYNSRCF